MFSPATQPRISRRTLFEFAASAAAGQKIEKRAQDDTAAAGATEDKTPRVGIVLSDFQGSEDHDGTKLEGLAGRVPPGAAPGAAHLDRMLRKAIELGNTRRGGLPAIVEAADWVVIKPQITARLDAAGRVAAGSVADPRLVRSLIGWLVERRLGRRITVAEAPAWSGEQPFDPWSSDWGGTYGGFSYRALIDEFSRKAPAVRFELLDLDRDETMPMQSPRQDAAAYQVAGAVMKCDKLITVAPLSTCARSGVMLTLGGYLGALPARHYGRRKEKALELAAPHAILADLYSFRPADYAILGGEWGLEGGGPFGQSAAPVRHNLVLAGANAVAVDAVAAAVMGFNPAEVRHLALAESRGFGTTNLDLIWTRGNEIAQARRPFRKPA